MMPFHALFPYFGVKIMKEAFTTSHTVQNDITSNSISVMKLWKPQ
jgi:hypothetical protein